MLEERDWVLRITKQLALFIARALKLIDEKKLDDALATLQAAGPEVLGLDLDTLDFGDVGESLELLDNPVRAMAWAKLLEGLGEVYAARGDAALARSRRERAVLVAHALVKRGEAADEAEALIARVTARLASDSA